jgi:hypothetical protein
VNAANFAGTAFSIAVEFALQASDIGGPTARLVGWGFVGLFAAWAAIHYLRCRREASFLPAVLEAAFDLGREMRKFVHMRESMAPPAPSSPGWQALAFWHSREPRGGGRSERDAYDAETMSIWTGRFAKKVSTTLAKLHNLDRIGHDEAKRMLAPASPAEVESLAVRLIDLGCLDI